MNLIKEPLIQQIEEESSNSPNDNFSSTLIRYLYIGHFLARWGARFVICDHVFIVN